MDTNPYAPPNATLDPVAGVPPGTPARVGFLPRLGASLLDFVVVGVLGFALMSTAASLFPSYLGAALARSQGKLGPNAPAQAVAMIGFAQAIVRWSLGAGLAGFFYWLIEGFTGRALGKLILGLRIANADGRKATPARLLARMAVKQSGALIAFVGMLTGVYTFAQVAQLPSWLITLGCLLVLGQKRQALHDLAAKTAVFRNTDVVLAER
jgi:uncharacterized RDD family membrane protein YckC